MNGLEGTETVVVQKQSLFDRGYRKQSLFDRVEGQDEISQPIFL